MRGKRKDRLNAARRRLVESRRSVGEKAPNVLSKQRSRQVFTAPPSVLFRRQPLSFFRLYRPFSFVASGSPTSLTPKRSVRTAVVFASFPFVASGPNSSLRPKRSVRAASPFPRRFSKSQKNFGVSRRRFWRARFSAVPNPRKRSGLAVRQASTFRRRKRDVRFRSRRRPSSSTRRLASRRKILGPRRRQIAVALRRKRRKSAPTFFIYAPWFKRRARVAFLRRRAAAGRCVSRQNPAKTKRRDVRFDGESTTQRNSSPTLAPPFDVHRSRRESLLASSTLHRVRIHF